jgi:hypothetical protein
LHSNRYKSVFLKKCNRQYANSFTETNYLNINDESNKLFYNIKHKYEWIIYVDIDEFIVTKKNFSKTIRDELYLISANYPEKRLILAPWVMMSGIKNEKNPKSVLKSITYRWDHDIKHPYPVKKFGCRYFETFCKSIFKPKYFDHIRDHVPICNDRTETYYNGVDLSSSRLREDKFLKLRNRDIDLGYFLCYHYRYISKEHAESKLNTNGWYINDGYTLKDLQASYAEIYDDTLLRK